MDIVHSQDSSLDAHRQEHVTTWERGALQVFQRQMSKEGLQAVVNGNDAAGGGWSSEMLRDLFTLRQDTASDTYDSRCRPADDDDMEDGHEAEQAVASPEHKLQVKHDLM